MPTVHDTKARKRPVSAREPVSAAALPDTVRQHLKAFLTALRDLEDTVIVAAGALRDENAPVGMCVAHILRTQVGNRLGVEIDRTLQFFSIELPSYRAVES